MSEFFLRRHYVLLLAAYVFLGVYVVWQYWLFSKQGWNFVSWHLHLAPYFLLLLVWASVRATRTITSNWFLAGLSLLFTLSFIEIALNVIVKEQLYLKYKYDAHNYYHTWPPNQVHQLNSNEFSYYRVTNSYGFADEEWSINKKGRKRVITLGDSFTEGDGAPADSSYPALLQSILDKRIDTVSWEVLNAGTCGSDPVFDYKKLDGLLLKHKPDVVIQALSSNDFMGDIARRGGFERFKTNNTIRYKPLHFWFYPAAINNIVRFAIRVLEHSLNLPAAETEVKDLELVEQQIISRHINIARNNRFRIIFVILPGSNEVADGKYTYNFDKLKARLQKHGQVIDLLPLYLSHISKSGKDVSAFYWERDKHHNSAGYKMMAECIASQIQ